MVVKFYFVFAFRFHWKRRFIKQGQTIRLRQQTICAMLQIDQIGQVRVQKFHHLNLIVASSNGLIFIAKAELFG